MKLAIGINIFGSYKRQDQCIQVLKKLKLKYPVIDLYNITFKEEINSESSFIHLPLLEKKARNIIQESKSNKPIAKDFFDILSKQECDYFIFLNSDVLLTEKAIKFILKAEYETYVFSRADCYPIDSFDKIVPYRIEIAGFDAWVCKKDWWVKNNDLFENYIYAEHLWDVSFALTMFDNSNSIICNKDIMLLHEKHELNWNETSLEALHNSNLWNKTKYAEKWKIFIYENLIKRKPYGQFLKPLYNEEELEKQFLKCN
jgi:hypothetical protein